MYKLGEIVTYLMMSQVSNLFSVQKQISEFSWKSEFNDWQLDQSLSDDQSLQAADFQEHIWLSKEDKDQERLCRSGQQKDSYWLDYFRKQIIINQSVDIM